MKPVPFRWSIIMPLLALAITVALSIAGREEAERASRGKIIWDYFSPAEAILHSINYPATAAVALVEPNHTLRIGMEYSKAGYILYLIFVGLFWLGAGLYVDQRNRTIRSRFWRIMIAAVIVAYSVTLAAIALSAWSIYPSILGASGLVWGAVLIGFALRVLVKDYQQT